MKALDEHLQNAPLEQVSLMKLAMALVTRVAEDHALDICRADLCPRNVMWDGESLVSLAESPKARRLPSELTDDEDCLASLAYFSPEECRGETASLRSDVFSIGAILYEAAVGEPAFEHRNSQRLLDQIESYEPPADLGRLRFELFREWDGILAICLSKEPIERYASALDLEQHLDALASQGGSPRTHYTTLHWPRVIIVLVVLLGLAWACYFFLLS